MKFLAFFYFLTLNSVYLTNIIKSFGYLSGYLAGYVADGRENYWADQDETSTTYSLQPRDGSAQKKILKKFKRGPEGALFC